MTAIVVGAFVVLGMIGMLVGGRHLYLRLDRPKGFECSLRVRHGAVAGLGPKFRAGYGGPEIQQLLWRRIAWPGPRVHIPVAGIRLGEARRPGGRERPAIPASFTVIPIDLDADTRIELAMPIRRVPRLVGLIGGPGTDPPRR